MDMETDKKRQPFNRRQFLKAALQGAAAVSVGGLVAAASSRSADTGLVWQINPFKCIQCGNCRVNCILKESAVKAVHDFTMCGYCDLCTGFFHPEPNDLNTGAENQLCPSGALVRKYTQEDPYFEYTIDETICTGCGKCVKGCTSFGNGSLYLQVRHDRCKHCNECLIAARCPAGAFIRVPADKPYVVKHLGEAAIVGEEAR